MALSNKNPDKLSYEELNNFFCTLGKDCKNNVEFCEVSNEALFQVLLSKPQSSLHALNDNASLELDFILSELSEPVNDGIDLQALHSKITQIKKYNNVRDKVLKAIQEAMSKD